MIQIIDPIILFIASNAIFIAIGALFSTISNEIFSFEKQNQKDIAKYTSNMADRIRKSIIAQAGSAYFIYILNFSFILIFFLYKYIIASILKINNNYADIIVVLFYILNISYLVTGTIKIFYQYFLLRQHFYFEKKNHDL